MKKEINNKKKIILLGSCLLIMMIFIIIITKNYKPNYLKLEERKPNKINDIEKSDNVKRLNIIINNQKYDLILEDNQTVNEFINTLPITITMNELNGNEKYAYLDKTYKTNSYSPKTINTGDVMLYGNNCLVIFYKTFNTSYSYTKIGHIDNLKDLGTSNIEVTIDK